MGVAGRPEPTSRPASLPADSAIFTGLSPCAQTVRRSRARHEGLFGPPWGPPQCWRKEAEVTTTVDIVDIEELDEAERPDDGDGSQVSPAIRELVSLLGQSYARMPVTRMVLFP